MHLPINIIELTYTVHDCQTIIAAATSHPYLDLGNHSRSVAQLTVMRQGERSCVGLSQTPSAFSGYR